MAWLPIFCYNLYILLSSVTRIGSMIKMIRKLKEILLYQITGNGDLKSVNAQVMEENRKFAIIWSIFQILYWGFCLFMSTRQPDYRMCRHVYIVAFSICVVSLLLALFAVPRVHWLIRPVALMVDIAFLGAGIGVAQLLAPKTIIIFASVLVIPVFFISDTLSTIVLLVFNIIVFSVSGKNTMEPETFSWVRTNLIIFSSIGLFLGYFVNRTRYERYLFADSAVKLAELQTKYAYDDPLTGLHNRRAYSEMSDQLATNKPAYCCVVMMDINGLKKTNDNLGHEAGDELIAGTAECIRQGFEGIDTVYRIGGDEFCAILTDPKIDAGQCIARINELGARWKGKYIKNVSVSCGCAQTEDFTDLDSITKEADRAMYEAKRNYYISNGIDRRRR